MRLLRHITATSGVDPCRIAGLTCQPRQVSHSKTNSQPKNVPRIPSSLTVISLLRPYSSISLRESVEQRFEPAAELLLALPIN